MDDGLIDDELRSTDLVPEDGGTWTGMLFDNARIGHPPQLTWSFTFRYRDIDRDYGHTSVALDLEWVPLATPSWQAIAGLAARSAPFGDAGEASLYYFEHHRYDRVELDIVGQSGKMANARFTVSGDVDRLGIESITADSWLRFDGITVAHQRSDGRGGMVTATGLHRHDRTVAQTNRATSQLPVRRTDVASRSRRRRTRRAVLGHRGDRRALFGGTTMKPVT